MTSFLILAGVMIALALAFVLPALTKRHKDEEQTTRARANVMIYRDQLAELDADLRNNTISKEQHDAGRREIERRVLEDTLASLNEAPPATAGHTKWVPIALSVIIPLAAVGLYLKLGTPQAVSPQMAANDPTSAQGNVESPHGTSFEKIREMAAKLAERLKQQPNDGEGWAMLARSYRVLGEFKEASDAYEKAIKLVPADAQLLADYADALAMAQGQSLEGEPMQLVERALKVDPNNLKALALAGTAAFDGKNYKLAVGYWQKAVKLSPPDSEFTQSLQSGLQEAQALAEGRTPPQDLPNIMPERGSNQAEAAAPASSAAAISGKVSLSPSLAAKVSPEDTVFIYARAESGPPMPLAILRKKASELPVSFTLDDNSAMSPNMRLSNFAKVTVMARVSKSGNAMPQSGDLEGQVGPIANNTSNVSIKVDRVIP
jgi:cytochrome c-type biogenesis protein CcmH